MRNGLLGSFARYVSLNVLGMLALSFYILADTFFVANGLGTAGLTALNLAISVYSFIHGTGLMLGIGGATRYSIQKSGCSSAFEGNRTFSAAVHLSVILGSMLFIIGAFFPRQLAELLGANAETVDMTTTYLRTILCFAPAFIINNVLIAFIRNDGSPRTAMTGMLVGSLSNIVLDYIFIFPMQMGMFGAAFATGLAPLISIAVMAPYFLKGKNQFHFVKGIKNTKLYAEICTLGVSSFVTEIASGIVLIVFNLRLLHLGGNITVAAYGVIANLSLIAIAIFTGVGQGVQPLVSTHYGAGRLENVNTLRRYAILLSTALAALIFVVVYVFGSDIAELFNGDENELFNQIATTGLRVYFVGFFFAGINVLLSIYFSAVEEARAGFAISLLRGFVLIVPLALLLSEPFGVMGIWLTFPLTEALVFALGIIKTTGRKAQIRANLITRI